MFDIFSDRWKWIDFFQSHNGGVGVMTATELKPRNCWFPSDQTFFLMFLIPYWAILGVTIYYVVRGAIAIRVAAGFAPTRKVNTFTTRTCTVDKFSYLHQYLKTFYGLSLDYRLITFMPAKSL